MFNIESYVTPILLSYVDKYVRDFNPANAQVSLWGGGVALHNLVLKADVLQQEVALPFTLVSGRIHELLIQVPWTKIMSEPIVVTIDTIECILSLNPSDNVVTETPRVKSQVVETPPGYMQALVRRVVTNIALRVHHLIVKYVHDDVVLSLNVKHLAVDSAAPDWTPTFADIDAALPVIRRTVRLDDLTLCLDRSDADGKIRFYQEPLLYRCQLDFRVLIGLTSANTRRAKNIEVQLRSEKLGWGITNEQLVMLLRLVREQPTAAPPPPAPKIFTQNTAQPLHSSSNLAEPTRNESWSEWAWSWLPAWGDGTGEVEEAPLSPTPAPLKFTVYLDHVSLVFKIMEVETSGRKRARHVMEASARYVAAHTQRCAPTTQRARIGVRDFTLRAHPGCLCGFTAAQGDESIVVLSKVSSDDDDDEWTWPDECLNEAVEIAVAIDEKYKFDLDESEPEISTSKRISKVEPILRISEDYQILVPPEPVPDNDQFWKYMAPVVFVEFSHNRAPADPFSNPYENPPTDFEYSDWVEEWKMKVTVQPLIVCLCAGVMHRLAAIQTIVMENLPPPPPDTPMRVLTVEECEYLNENLPQRQISFDVRGLRVQLMPWSHSSKEKPAPPLIMLDLELPSTNLLMNSPLYPDRVCQAACQMPDEEGPVWQGARVHASGELCGVELRVTAPGGQPRPCARLQARFVFHCLLHPKYFTKKRTNLVNYTFKISEINLCGSAARLQTAWQILQSLLLDRQPMLLRQTTLARDALNDEEWVAIDMTCEDISLRSYVTKNIMTNIMTMQSARATALHAPSGETVRQAWLFSAPDSTSATPFFRGAIQLCTKPVPYARDFVAVWTEPLAICVDPLFIAWLAYKPQMKPVVESQSLMGLKASSTSLQYMLRRRVTPPSSSGRVSGSGADFVHASRPRSSSSEPSDRRDSKPTPLPAKPLMAWWDPEKLSALHSRLKRARLSAEVGLVLVYVVASSASAVDCVCVRDAMERHAATEHRVLALSLGRLSAHTAGQMKHLWQEIRHDGPTFFKPKSDATTEEDYFPWKLRVADISCYTLEMRSASAATEGHERSAMGLRSKLKIPCAIVPKTILELITITATLSVVTKSMHITSWVNPHEKKRSSTSSSSKAKPEPQKTRYFTTGVEFKPHTLKEFVRGPAKRQLIPPESQLNLKFDNTGPVEKTTSGPLLSLGVNLHIDTPPIVVRLDQEQVCVASTASHCVQHVLALFKRDQQVQMQRQEFTSLGSSHRSLIRSVSELDELNSQSEETEVAELIPIFEPHHRPDVKLKSFFWFQWVLNRATVIVSSGKVKLALEIEDVIASVDLQAHYDQLKVKVASASIRHYVRNGSREWMPGKMNGRVLEVREPANDKEDEQFLTLTITQAQISNLPKSWKEELHPKLLQQPSTDSMWEIYMTLAPLEAVLHGELLDDIVSLAKELSPISYCPLQTRSTKSIVGPWQWPFCYLTAGGLRLIITSEKQDDNADDTILFHIGRISVNPHPENPICRRLISSGPDTGWTTAGSGHYEGRQYELSVKHVGVQSTHFAQLLHYEDHPVHRQATGLGNPAVKWSQTRKAPVITTILYNVDVGCVGAPALFVGGSLVCGPALDLSLVSDCAIELNVAQLRLLCTLVRQLSAALKQGPVHEEYWNDQINFDVCPYVAFLKRGSVVTEETPAVIETTNIEVELKSTTLGDSGVDTATSHSTSKLSRPEENPYRRPVSVAFAQDTGQPSDHMEVFVTMGVIEVSLFASPPTPPPSVCIIREVSANELLERPHLAMSSSDESLSIKKDDTILHLDQLPDEIQDRDKSRNLSVPLLQMTLHQPNLYYWKRKSQKTLQMSLFDMSLSVGLGPLTELLISPLLSTARGMPDPVTDIPPALATFKVVVPAAGELISGSGGSVRLDIERPVQLQVSTQAVLRLQEIRDMINKNETKSVEEFLVETIRSVPFLHRLRRLMGREGIESVVLETGQVSVCGEEGCAGWGSASAQAAVGSRAERLTARALVSALAVSAGPPADTRRLLLHPTIIGIEAYANWDAWRKVESGTSAREPIVSVVIDLDHVTLDISPADVDALSRIRNDLAQILPEQIFPTPNSPDSVYQKRRTSLTSHTSVTTVPDPIDDADHYYKDDLRSGAFKIVGGGQLPMAYQVLLHGCAVSWRYPHPRAITRIVAFPLPGQDEEVKCVLEMYNTMLSQWEPHTYFKLPVGEPRELLLYAAPPEATFAVMWRFRVYDNDEPTAPFEFNVHKYKPRPDPFVTSSPPGLDSCKSCAVTAEQLSGVLRVDSYFAPRLLPRYKLAVRVCAFELHLHNALAPFDCQTAGLEGYYVSKPLTRSHRVLTLSARETVAHARLHSPAGKLMLVQTTISGDILECGSGTMQRVVSESHMQCAFASAEAGAPSGRARARMRCSQLLVTLNAPRIRTLMALVRDWNDAYKRFKETEPTNEEQPAEKTESILSKDEMCDVEAAMVGLEGRVSLWVHNETSAPLRLGQDGTDEIMPLPAAVQLAYRWRYPASPKCVRFALAGPSADWVWSHSIPFSAGSYRVRLGDPDNSGSEGSDKGPFLHVKVEEFGSRRCMRVSGRLALANLLRHNILYKLNMRDPETKQWRMVSAGELKPESVGGSVICSAENELSLKIKFPTHDKGWSGDIPLKECPKENVPWLVKVPSTGSVPYMSVWCRVVRTRADGRLLAALWPLYVLHSHLPLDTDVTITSEGEEEEMPALVQTAAGRGATSHLMAPGTTAHKHSLNFRYRDFDSSVTRDAAPLHYGVTQVSVFEKRQLMQSVEDLMPDILGWLERYGLNAKSSWPYSIVTSHWPQPWQYALLQPRCDVTVRYNGVVAGGGGCGLAVHLCPHVLFCNASPLALTLRAHDAAPLCKLEPGQAIAPPSTLLTRPFFMSMEIGREVFVSGQLQVGSENLGRYGCPPPGVVALEREAFIAIQCNHKVALLTMFYEIKEDINVIGLTSTYVLINRLNIDIHVSAIAVPNDTEDDVVLTPRTFKIVPPTEKGSVHGTPLTKLWVWRRWRGRQPHELRGYLCVTLGGEHDARPVPLRLGHPPLRRAVALHHDKDQSRAVVFTQVNHEGRWVVTVADDPCPQFVVYNRTETPLAVAQPRPVRDRPDALHIKAMSECAGAEWVCEVGAGVATHYSTPGHNARYPPDPAAVNFATTDVVSMLTFSKIAEGKSLVWCPPVAATGGEQLLQLSGVTVKMRVYSYPHSTLVELHDVHQLDISASDIRRRLQGSFTSDLSDMVPVKSVSDTQSTTLDRVNAKDHLLVHCETPTAASKQEVALKAPALDAIKEAAPSPTQSVKTLSESSSSVELKDSNNTIITIQDETMKDPDIAKTKKPQDKVELMELKPIEISPVTNIGSPTNTDLGISASFVTLDKANIPPPGGSVSIPTLDKAIISASIVTLDKANIPALGDTASIATLDKGNIQASGSCVSIVTLDKANIPAAKRISELNASATKLVNFDAKSGAANAKTHKSFFYDAILSNPDTDIVKLSNPMPDILPTISGIVVTSNITVTTEPVTPITVETDIVTPNIAADKSDIITSSTSASTESNIVVLNDMLTTEVENMKQSDTVLTDDTVRPDSEQDKTAASLETKGTKDLKKVVLLGESEVKSLSMDSCLDHGEDIQNVEEKGSVLDPVTAFLAGNDDSSTSFIFQDPEWGDSCGSWTSSERARCVVAGIVVQLATTPDAPPLLAAHLDRVALLVLTDPKGTRTIMSVSDVQLDNMQYESGQFDFAVVATTGGKRLSKEEAAENTPCCVRLKNAPLWAIFLQREEFATKQQDARLLMRIRHDRWTVLGKQFNELTEVEVRLGPLALYVEDALVAAGEPALRLLLPQAQHAQHPVIADSAVLQNPLRLRMLHIHPLDLTLTLHTAVRVYIALDQSPLRLSAFRLRNLMTSPERLSHALTVHYLSAAILGAGWVVGGLELLGAPGALAARVSSASGGVRGVAAAAAAALLRSVSAAACSLARNLDLLAGDEEHARRAAAARRLTPPSLIAGLVAGVTNFAINILGAVGGLAHHPLLGVAAGETESSATALRRGLVGALAKPLSATADLVAYAGHGLLSQTGWDPVPKPRENLLSNKEDRSTGWRRDCVRWAFRLADTSALAGFEVLLNNAPLHLLLTHKYLVVVDPDSERIVEMIDYRFCTLAPYQGPIIELSVSQRRATRLADARVVDEDDEYKMSSVAMARVARYTGADGAAGGSTSAAIGGGEARALALVPRLGRSLALHAALQAALHHNSEAHFSLL